MRNQALVLIVLAGLATSASIAPALMDDHAPKSKPSSALPAKKDAYGAPDAPAKTTKASPKAHASDKTAKHNEHDAKVSNKTEPKSETNANEGDPSRSASTQSSISADDALSMLVEGNQRWVKGRCDHPSADSAKRELTAENGQRPFATILSCADSRIPLERVFDRGVGELFVVRVEGNIAGASETGTIEYGVGHLKTKLLVVMGHTKCGAVAAACSGAKLHGKLGELVGSITPAVERARRNNPGANESELATLAVKENVWESIYDLLRESKEIRSAVDKHDLKVVGAIYDIATGKVEFLGEHPWQSELIGAINSTRSAPTRVAAEPVGNDEGNH